MNTGNSHAVFFVEDLDEEDENMEHSGGVCSSLATISSVSPVFGPDEIHP